MKKAITTKTMWYVNENDVLVAIVLSESAIKCEKVIHRKR